MRINKLIFKKNVITLILMLVAVLEAQEFGDFEQLTLEISADLKEILPMEPLPITITLYNKTEVPIMSIANINPSFGLIQIYIAEESQTFEKFRSSDWALKSGPRVESVREPGFKKSVTGYYFYAHPTNLDKEKRGQYLFESPGIYQIKAIFKDSKIEKQIESNVLKIEAKEPKREDAAAYKFIKEMQDDEDKEVYYGNFLLRSYDYNKPQIMEKQKEFIRKFPNSKYSRLLYYSLGLTYTSEKNLKSQEEQKTVKRGIEYLEKAAGYEDFFLAKDSILHLIEILSEVGETDKAMKYKRIFAKRFPDSTEGRDYIEEVYMASSEEVTKKPLGVVLPIAAAAIAGVVIAGFVLLSRKKQKPTDKSAG